MVDGNAETSQPGQAPSEQRHPTYPVPDGDPLLAKCDLDPLLDDVHQGSRVGAAQG